MKAQKNNGHWLATSATLFRIAVLAVWLAMQTQFAGAQVVRGELIDSPLGTNSLATNESPVKQTITNARSKYMTEAPPGFHRMPFNPTNSLPAGAQPAKPAFASVAPTNSAPVYLKDGYWVVGFDKLSAFPAETVLEPPDPVTHTGGGPKMVGEIPDDVKSLDGKSVALKGFMMPLKYRMFMVTECLLLKNQSMCCYGVPPRFNEWVIVRMNEGAGIKPVMDVPVTICGKLHVGEYRENTRLRAIYQLDGEKMEGPEDSR